MRVAPAALLAAVLVAAGCGGDDGRRLAPPPSSPVVEHSPSPMAYGVKGRATWYAARCPSGVVYLGRTDTCEPYVAKRDGGRGGELSRYCAVGWWTWKAQPVVAEVYFHATGRTTTCVVRDYCEACAKGRAVIDLSPLVFLESGLTLGHGVAKVSVRYLGAR